MATQEKWKSWGNNPGVKTYYGSFAPAGTGAVTSVKGRGFSVARSGVGVFTITFDKTYPELLSAVATLQLATPTDQFVNVGNYDSSAGTLILDVWDVSGAGATDITADADNRINFSVSFMDSSLSVD